MHVLFIWPNLNAEEGFSHGVACLSGALKARGHRTSLMNLNEAYGPVPTTEQILRRIQPLCGVQRGQRGAPERAAGRAGDGLDRPAEWITTAAARRIVVAVGATENVAVGELGNAEGPRGGRQWEQPDRRG